MTFEEIDRDFRRGTVQLVAGSVFLIFLVVGFGVAGSWYQAGVQAEVYRREGIEISQWEVFIGAKPAERSIRIKE